MNDTYNYETAGFDGFLSRSIDNLTRPTLSAPGPVTTQIRYDSAGISGMLGDTLQIGNIRLENTRIVINDGTNDFLLMGEEVYCG